MKLPQIALVVALSAVTAFAVGKYNAAPSASTAKQETAFERVMRTGTLRCGYYVFAPATMRDPNTGKLSGLSVDMMEAIGRNTGLRIEWTEETDFGNWHAGLISKRFDAMCTPMWPDGSLARIALFTRPMLYASINAYARTDDHRFDNNLSAINDQSIKVVSFENDPTTTIAKANFPKASLTILPPSAPSGAAGEDVKLKKADILLWDANGAYEFNKYNGNAIRNIDPAHPLKVMPFELLTSIDEPQLRDFLDVSLQELENSGDTARFLDKWEQSPNSFFRLIRPYVSKE